MSRRLGGSFSLANEMLPRLSTCDCSYSSVAPGVIPAVQMNMLVGLKGFVAGLLRLSRDAGETDDHHV